MDYERTPNDGIKDLINIYKMKILKLVKYFCFYIAKKINVWLVIY